MPDNREAITAALMANKTAWSSLLGALIIQGSVDPQLVYQHLKSSQEALYLKGLTSLAEAIDMYILAVEAWTLASFDA
ncbi:TPA: hypothetical protein ACKP1J_004494 [Serratia liquefaciens]